MRPALPAEVIAALEAGRTIEAIKLLREATGLGLKEAKDAVDAHVHGTHEGGAAKAGDAAMPDGALPPPVQQALQRGNKIEAIRLLREHTGLGLKEAKERVEAAQGGNGGLAPGEVPRRPGAGLWVVAVLIVAAVAYYLLQRGG